jgi:hypothetical protein
MEVTKEQVLESMNTYCTERKYGSEALTDGFKEKFSNFIVKKYEGKDVEEADFTADLHFNLDTAFSASIDLKNTLTSQFATKENEYKNQITELNKKIATPQPQPQPQQFELPEDVKNQLAELEKFKTEQSKQEKRKTIMELAKKNVRQDLHSSFVNYASDFEVQLDKDDKEQADALVAKYQKVMQPTYGDIKPLAPRQVQKRDEEILDSIKEVKVC